MLPLDACTGRADVGAKAETLARARAAGLAVADGVVLLPGEPVDAAALAAAATRLGGARFVVRSSAALEDRAGGSAAGVFVSVVGVAADALAQAVDEVRASASAAPVRAYLATRGLPDGAAAMAVLVQPYVEADAYGVAHSAVDGFAVEERAPGVPEWGDARAARLARDDAGPLATGLRALETLVGGPVDAEFARRGDVVTWLQARPLVAARAATTTAPALPEPGRWRRDAEHNPDPLSAAQASLVAFVDALGVGARQRVAGGHLYVESGGARPGLRPVAPAVLRRHFDADVMPDCARHLASAAADGSLEAALAAYAHVYRRYVGELSPSLAEARAALDRFLGAQLGEPLRRHGALLAGLGGATLARDQALWELGRAMRADAERATAAGAGFDRASRTDANRSQSAGSLGADGAPAPEDTAGSEVERLRADYLARYADHAPAWDVAVATDGERPDRVAALATRWAASDASPLARHAEAERVAASAAAALAARLDPAARPAFAVLLATARDVLPIAEDDDLLFLRAQAAVRRALLARAAALGLAAPDDVFALSLDEVKAPPSDVAARVAARHAAAAADARRPPPSAYQDGRPEWSAPPASAVLRGAATSGHARGRAVVIRALADAPTTLPPDAVLVAPALVPSLGPLLPQARALVTDHGGALSHGATLAREYGVPAVLGARGATALPDGADLWVDGDAGRVYVLDGATANGAADES